MDGVMTTMIDGINYNEDGDHPKNMIFVTKLNSSKSKFILFSIVDKLFSQPART